MTIRIDKLRLILIAIFAFISIGSIIISIYLIRLSAIGSGYGGRYLTVLEMIWELKGFVLISIYSIAASLGLLKNKKSGLIFGYTIPFALMAFSLWLIMTDFLLSVLFLGISILFVIGLNKLKITQTELRINEYLISVVLAVLMLLSFYFIFS
jgi:hypothetical protein